MSAFESPRPVPFGSIAVHRVVVFADRIVARVRGWRVEHDAEIALGGLTDRELADIGLTRADIHGALGRRARG